MSTVDPHAEAHRLKNELGYGARRIADELGITRHAATQLLAQPLADQPAGVAGQVAGAAGQVAGAAGKDGQPPAELVAGVAAPSARVADEVAAGDSQLPADQPLAVADRVAEGGRPVAAAEGRERRPVAELRLPRRVADPLAGMDVSQWRALSRDLAVLAETGRTPEALVHQAVTAMAYAYRLARKAGDLEPGQWFLVADMTLRPSPHSAARPETAERP
ncbi:hypothetical protein ACPXCS_06105 [Streptomyces sp. DT190]|uniref:hypothetical protein n=1 Tax=unclassified Streptomyces TaxID=2593676 RepID=UPI003CF80C2D